MKDTIITFLILAIFLIFADEYIEQMEQTEQFEFFGITSVEKQNSKLKSFDPKNVNTITFRKNQYTSGNRTNPIKQLNCVGGNACSKSHAIDMVQCKNMGVNDSNDIQWKCETDLPSNLSIGDTNINCEGYSDNTDKLKLVNSCGLEYSLNDIDKWKSYDYGLYDHNLWIFIFVLFVVFLFIYFISVTPRSYYSVPVYDPYLDPYYRGYYAPPILMEPPYRHQSSSYLYSDSPSSTFKTSISFGQITTR